MQGDTVSRNEDRRARFFFDQRAGFFLVLDLLRSTKNRLRYGTEEKKGVRQELAHDGDQAEEMRTSDRVTRAKRAQEKKLVTFWDSHQPEAQPNPNLYPGKDPS